MISSCLWTCRMYHFPLPAVWTFAGYPFHHRQHQQNGRAGCITFNSQQYGRPCTLRLPFHRQQYALAGCIRFHSQQYGRAWCIPSHHQQYELAVCVHFYRQQYGHAWCTPFLNAGMSGCPVPKWTKMPMPELAQYRNERAQSGAGMLQCRSKTRDAGMTMPAASTSMPMPSYGKHLHNIELMYNKPFALH